MTFQLTSAGRFPPVAYLWTLNYILSETVVTPPTHIDEEPPRHDTGEESIRVEGPFPVPHRAISHINLITDQKRDSSWKYQRIISVKLTDGYELTRRSFVSIVLINRFWFALLMVWLIKGGTIQVKPRHRGVVSSCCLTYICLTTVLSNGYSVSSDPETCY